MRPNETGYTQIFLRETSTHYMARLEDFERLSQEFMAGKAFLEFRGVYGSKIILKTACVEAIAYSLPANLQAQKDDNNEEEKEAIRRKREMERQLDMES